MPAKTVQVESGTKRSRSPKKPAFDRSQAIADEQSALRAALFQADSLAALAAALRQLLSARIQLQIGKKIDEVFGLFDLSLNGRQMLMLRMKASPEVIESKVFLYDSVLFKGLPNFRHTGMSGALGAEVQSVVFPAPPAGDQDPRAAQFHLFWMKVSEYGAASVAWQANKASLIQAEMVKSRGEPSNQAVQDLETLSAHRAELQSQIEALDREIEQATNRVSQIEKAVEDRVMKTEPPLLVYLNSLRLSLGMKSLL